MNYWRGQPITNLSPSDVMRAANEAINELVGMQESRRRRESFDSLVLSFALGACFSAAAMYVGVILH
jgi:hypothetical protein